MSRELEKVGCVAVFCRLVNTMLLAFPGGDGVCWRARAGPGRGKYRVRRWGTCQELTGEKYTLHMKGAISHFTAK